jgi:putative ABC transport system substrate-binding protein
LVAGDPIILVALTRGEQNPMFDLRRRRFITLLGSAVAWPVAARAQRSVRVYRVGMLTGQPEADPENASRLAAFRQTLSTFGWSEGRNLQIDIRWGAGDPGRMRVLAKELSGLAPDIVVAESTPATATLRQEIPNVPIVFSQVANPVGAGFAASLARPGGNTTGFTNFEPSMGGKWLELLKEVAPHVARTAAIFNPKTHSGQYWQSIEVAAPSLAVTFTRSPVGNTTEIERAIQVFARDPNGGLLVMPDSFTISHRELIVALAERHRLPSIYPYRVFTAGGGLLSYGVDQVEIFRRIAAYVDRILRGTNPGELPIEGPTKFELAVNLKTAKALGIEVPPMMLARADEVIE